MQVQFQAVMQQQPAEQQLQQPSLAGALMPAPAQVQQQVSMGGWSNACLVMASR